jgi:hypothetical protein
VILEKRTRTERTRTKERIQKTKYQRKNTKGEKNTNGISDKVGEPFVFFFES